MAAAVQWLGHASFRIDCNGPVVYIDPWKLKKEPHDAKIVLISHSHYDHYSADDIKKVAAKDTNFIGPADVVAKYGSGQSIKPGQTIQIAGLKITAVAAYNPSKQFHPKSNDWVGFIIEKDNLRIYYAGDTDETGEMKKLKDIDLAMLPVGGTYTMDASEAAQAVKDFKPKQAIPYHFGDIVGTIDDGKKFAKLADCDVHLLQPGESVTIKK